MNGAFTRKTGVIKVYAIIYWENDDTVKPLLNNDGTLRLFNYLDGKIGADATAERLEKRHKGWETRVISIDGVSE